MYEKNNSRGVWVVFSPYPNKFIKMMSAEDGWVPRQVIEIIHYDGNE